MLHAGLSRDILDRLVQLAADHLKSKCFLCHCCFPEVILVGPILVLAHFSGAQFLLFDPVVGITCDVILGCERKCSCVGRRIKLGWLKTPTVVDDGISSVVFSDMRPTEIGSKDFM